jgi:hypothetical protein
MSRILLKKINHSRMSFRACPENKKPLGNPNDFLEEKKSWPKGWILPFSKYIIGKQGNNLKW